MRRVAHRRLVHPRPAAHRTVLPPPHTCVCMLDTSASCLAAFSGSCAALAASSESFLRCVASRSRASSASSPLPRSARSVAAASSERASLPSTSACSAANSCSATTQLPIVRRAAPARRDSGSHGSRTAPTRHDCALVATGARLQLHRHAKRDCSTCLFRHILASSAAARTSRSCSILGSRRWRCSSCTAATCAATSSCCRCSSASSSACSCSFSAASSASACAASSSSRSTSTATCSALRSLSHVSLPRLRSCCAQQCSRRGTKHIIADASGTVTIIDACGQTGLPVHSAPLRGVAQHHRARCGEVRTSGPSVPAAGSAAA